MGAPAPIDLLILKDYLCIRRIVALFTRTQLTEPERDLCRIRSRISLLPSEIADIAAF